VYRDRDRNEMKRGKEKDKEKREGGKRGRKEAERNLKSDPGWERQRDRHY